MKLVELFETHPINIFGNQRSREGFDRMAAGAPKQASFVFGRFQPLTIGHKQLLDTLAKSAIGGEYYIFLSKSHDATKNPLDYKTKIKFFEDLFPEYVSHLVVDKDIKTPIMAANWLYEKGIRALTMVAGGDRIDDFSKMLETWNSKEVREKDGRHSCYINLVSSGEREDGSEGLAGISATNARDAAKDGDLKKFIEATGISGKIAERMYIATRRGMGYL